MHVRLIVLSAVVASATLFSMAARAHDPKEFDRMMTAPEAKAVPATCVRLAASHNYSNDVTNADIKALKARCDAANRAAAKKAAPKKAAPKKAAKKAPARKAAAKKPAAKKAVKKAAKKK